MQTEVFLCCEYSVLMNKSLWIFVFARSQCYDDTHTDQEWFKEHVSFQMYPYNAK